MKIDQLLEELQKAKEAGATAVKTNTYEGGPRSITPVEIEVVRWQDMILISPSEEEEG